MWLSSPFQRDSHEELYEELKKSARSQTDDDPLQVVADDARMNENACDRSDAQSVSSSSAMLFGLLDESDVVDPEGPAANARATHSVTSESVNAHSILSHHAPGSNNYGSVEESTGTRASLSEPLLYSAPPIARLRDSRVEIVVSERTVPVGTPGVTERTPAWFNLRGAGMCLTGWFDPRVFISSQWREGHVYWSQFLSFKSTPLDVGEIPEVNLLGRDGPMFFQEIIADAFGADWFRKVFEFSTYALSTFRDLDSLPRILG